MGFFTVYYFTGLAWLLSGVFTGWLKVETNAPLLASIAIIVGATIWPFFVAKILWDLVHGRLKTRIF